MAQRQKSIENGKRVHDRHSEAAYWTQSWRTEGAKWDHRGHTEALCKGDQRHKVIQHGPEAFLSLIPVGALFGCNSGCVHRRNM